MSSAANQEEPLLISTFFTLGIFVLSQDSERSIPSIGKLDCLPLIILIGLQGWQYIQTIVRMDEMVNEMDEIKKRM